MDTRAKIVSPQEALRLARGGATVVSGYFDPLTAGHAARLKAAKDQRRPLLVLIVSGKDPILPASARVELVAGLAAVDYVSETTAEIQPTLRLEAEHRADLERLMRHVRQRRSAGA